MFATATDQLPATELAKLNEADVEATAEGSVRDLTELTRIEFLAVSGGTCAATFF